MGFLGAMFITKIYQTAMGRAGTDKETRKNIAIENLEHIARENKLYKPIKWTLST